MKRPSPLWYVLAILACANFLHYGNRNVVGTMYDDLRVLFSANDVSLGLLTTAFMVPHAPATLLFGWLSDRLDRRRVLSIGVFFWSISALGASLAQSMEQLLVARAFVGLATATCVPVGNAIICTSVPQGKKALAASTFNLGLFLGGAVGAVLGEKLHFPLGIVALALPGFILTLLILRFRLAVPVATPQVAEVGLLKGIQTLLRIRSYRLTAIGAVLMAFAVGGYGTWFYDFLENSKGASENEALTILGLVLFAGLAGVLVGGKVADLLMRTRPYGRQLAIAIGMGSSVPLALVVLVLPLGGAFYLGSFLFMFMINWYHGPLAASVDDLVMDHQSGLAQGLYIALMHLLGTAPAAYLVGVVAGEYGLFRALLLPTGALLLAALTFLLSLRGVANDLVLHRES